MSPGVLMQPKYALLVPKQPMTCFYFKGGALDNSDPNDAALKTKCTKGALQTIVNPMILPWI
eukprot:1807805-Ditylum_brightwellii.AAC.1